MITLNVIKHRKKYFPFAENRYFIYAVGEAFFTQP